ncbi:hypothetical protein B0T19DRAFT_425134 [Cercophora scortea]|uniref:Uncharacterized protein n=1 Tax=Cercophora scortea TaxID=314031 RepID=A0AAE0IPA6_9PEZI|nr:hypothetical protein B0T19DRAFT_425134 [Cercophora scortea]
MALDFGRFKPPFYGWFYGWSQRWCCWHTSTSRPSGRSMLCVFVIHILGDPIDSMWSMLTRLEANRRFYQRASVTSFKSHAAIATIWSTYDELGLQDASHHFFEALLERGAPPGHGRGGSPYPHATGRRTPTMEGSNPLTRWTERRDSRDHQAQAAAMLSGGGGSVHHGPPQDSEPDAAENYLIECAAQHLQSNRDESLLTTIVALFGLGGALAGAFIRTWAEKRNNQTAHTIAIVCLLFNIIPIIHLSSQLGAFTSSTAAVHIIQKLRRDLASYNLSRRGPGAWLTPLFPPLAFNDNLPWDELNVPRNDAQKMDDLSRDGTKTPTGNISNLLLWPRIAAYSGMNASWRLQKRLVCVDKFDRHHSSQWKLGLSAFFVICCGSFLPALVISYRTPLMGFGCRSLSWRVIMALWLISMGLDMVLQQIPQFKKAKRLWRATLSKDTLMAALIIAIMAAAQAGLLNSCFCRSGNLTAARTHYINLNPLEEEWFLWIATPIGALVVIVVYMNTGGTTWKEARTLLNHDRRAREQDVIRINNLRIDLPVPFRTVLWNASRAPSGADLGGHASSSATTVTPELWQNDDLGPADNRTSSTSFVRPQESREPLLRPPYSRSSTDA